MRSEAFDGPQAGKTGACTLALSLRCAGCLAAMFLGFVSCKPDDRLEQARVAAAAGETAVGQYREAAARGAQDEAVEHLRTARDRLREARDLYLLAGADRSQDLETLVAFAEVAERTEDYDLAAKAFGRAARFAPDAAEYWLRSGRNHVRVGAGAASEAQAALEQCLERSASSEDATLAAQAHAELGHLYRKLGLYDAARTEYELALVDGVDNLGARLGLVGLDFREGRVLEAEAAIDAVGQQDAVSAVFLDAMLRFGYEGFKQDRVWFPDRSEHHLAYAKLLIRLGQLQEALSAAERAVSLDDTRPVAWNLLGSLARQLGDVDRAREAFERSLALDPDQERTREALKAIEHG